MRSRRYSVTKSHGGVSCVSRSPLKKQHLCPHRSIFIPWTSRARHEAAPNAPSTKGNYKNSECEQLHHVGHGYPLNSERQFRNTLSHKLDMDTLSYLRDSFAERQRWSKSRDWETQLNINRKEEDFFLSSWVKLHSQSKRSCQCLTQAALAYSLKNPWWKGGTMNTKEHYGGHWSLIFTKI